MPREQRPVETQAVAAGEIGSLGRLGVVQQALGSAAKGATGVEIGDVALIEGRVEVADALRRLAARGLTQVMSEGGPRVGSALIAQGLADEVVLVTNPKPLARRGVPALREAARARLSEPGAYRLTREERAGHDLFSHYEKV